MTRKETAAIMQILKTAYPRFYSGPDAPNMTDSLQLWTEMFADDNAALVAAAVKSYIASDLKGYPPTIGLIKNAMDSLTQTGAMDADQAWELIRKAASRSGYEAHKEFKRLPENLQRMVGSPGQLHEWSQMDSDIFNSVVASNFKRAFRVRQESDRRDRLLPGDVRKVISALAHDMSDPRQISTHEEHNLLGQHPMGTQIAPKERSFD